MKKKKLAVRICAVMLAAGLIAADMQPAFAAAQETAEKAEAGIAGDIAEKESAAPNGMAGISDGIKEEPGTSGGTEEKPGTSGGIKEELGTSGGTEEEPGTSGGIKEEPGISGGIKEEPGTSGGTEEEPGTSGGEEGSGTFGEIKEEPKTPSEPEGTGKEPEIPGETQEGPEFFAVPEPKDVPETNPGQQEPKDGLIYVNGELYSGYYLDAAGVFCLVSKGAAEPKSGTVSAGTEYYSSADQKIMKLPKDTVYKEGKAYTGYYLDNGIFYLVTDGAAEPVSGTIKDGTDYYSSVDDKMAKLSGQTVFVDGKPYTGYYLENDVFYLVSGGKAEVKTGTVGKGTKYYSCGDQGMKELPDQTVFVKGKTYTGYYLDSRKKLYKVKNGVRTLHTGTLKAKTKYYSYNEAKTRKLSKKTLYVKGKVYTGYYLNSKKKLYKAKKGTCTLHTGTVKAGTKYFNYNTGKKKKLSKDTLYVKGKVYTGYFQDGKKKLYKVKKGTRTLQTGVLNAGTKYYSYSEKKTRTLSKDTLYVQGKVYTGYYLDSGNIMYSVNDGKCAPVNAALNAGTGYYSYNDGGMRALEKTTVYINGKAMEGMSPESLATLQRAQAVVAGITNDSMTREQKLRVCFDYVKEAYTEIKPRIPHYLGMDWPVIYANDMFVNGAGNCCSYAAAFAYMAKAIGYEEVYCCNSGGHGWAEIDGLIYDPEWSKWHHVYNYFALSYDAKTDQGYKGAIGAGKPWMRVKI
ncbi:MAG: hypothetical protein HFH49_15470 [Lachnospiraceae bacterium]|nr:hypothetical protein [Lachnospiraceae bacterium]